MSVAVMSDLTKSYGAELIFSGVSFRVDAKDRIGLVGPNGAGKTTLLNILAGKLDPDGGSVSLAAGVATGYLPQIADFHPSRALVDEMRAVFAHVHAWEAELAELAARMSDPAVMADASAYNATLERYAELQARFEHAGGYTIEQRVRQVLDGLGFTREQQEAPATRLSGGQQTRAALGRLLLLEPDLLLLDEPTNHLDLAALEWLEEYLINWRGSVIVVSHDRYFLDRVTTRTIEIAHQRAELYPGAYSRYVQMRAERLERWRKEYEAQQDHIAHTEEFIRRYKAGQRAKEARGRQKLLDRLERIERPPVEGKLKFHIGSAIEPGEIILTTEKLAVGYQDRDGGGLRVAMADTKIERGDRVGLIGPNGGGKTTLLRVIVGQLSPVEGRATLGHNVQIGYYAQTHENLNLNATLVDEIRGVSHLSEEGARGYLGRFLFSGDDVFKPVGALSGGERSRIALAKLTLQGANFLVLDEPTNHLDLPAREALEAILREYDGTLLFVSHDRYFVDGLATTIWALEDGAVTVHEGNYTRYRTLRAQAAQAAQAAQRQLQAAQRAQARPATEEIEEEAGPGAAAAPTRLRSGKRGKRGDAATVRSVEQVEREISAHESRLASLEADLASASAEADITRIGELGDEYERERALLDALYTEWQALAS
ncbi:MAG TPA: ABC-F family ATP-binding cassette domain-containing protein [Ktedonobacterales bacterium]|nr:ABC-F family ATP-binding cassette domain-containing protein [Ktedonobacterales bacterium]